MLITPYRNILFNRILYKMKVKTKPWVIGRQVYWITDTRKSKTPEIVYEELVRGMYDIPFLDPDDVVIDLGAHVGMFTIPLAFINKKVTFICVEPNPTNFKNLVKNVGRYNLHNVILINAGVWDAADIGLSSQYPIDNTGGSHTIVDNTSTVKSHTWAQIQNIAMHYTRSKVIKVLKCDIEGAEHLIFKSSNDFKLVDAIRIEIHGSAKQTMNLTKLVANNTKDYIIQRLYGEKVENLEKEEYSMPHRLLRTLDGSIDMPIAPFSENEVYNAN